MIKLLLPMLLFMPFISLAATQAGIIKDDTPIEIESDSLEVEQLKSRALFRGNVVALQGPMTLKSDKMYVYYHNEASGEQSQSIKRIEVFGNVFLKRPGEIATGNKGFYNIAKDTLEITGNVVLKQGGHTVMGDHFRHIPSTGYSTMLSASPTDAPTTSKTKKGRVRGVFMPNQEAQ